MTTQTNSGKPIPPILIMLVAALTGFAALTFETLWFRRLGLVVGNTAIAGVLTLAAFMCGLALGNRWAITLAKAGHGLRAFALAEIMVGVSGYLLVADLPNYLEAVTPAFQQATAKGWDDYLRFALAFIALLPPAVAMGLGLPLMAKDVAAQADTYGQRFGHIYGANLGGAMLGALAGEFWLLSLFGVLGTAAIATLANIVAALGAAILAVRAGIPKIHAEHSQAYDAQEAKKILWASAAAGCALIALELSWFRQLRLFSPDSGQNFALMLALVLLAIGLGSWVAGWWLKFEARAIEACSALASLAGAAVVLGFLLLDPIIEARAIWSFDATVIAQWAVILMAPTAFFSGLLFTVQAAALRNLGIASSEVTGRLTFYNGLGGAFGAVLAGLTLLPQFGAGIMMLIGAGIYGCAALLQLPKWNKGLDKLSFAGLFVLVLALAAFPKEKTQQWQKAAAENYRRLDDSKIAMSHEDVDDHITLLRKDLMGQPYSYRVMSNGYSMSSTHRDSLRYMRLFAFTPLILNQQAKRALVISHGLGSTTRVLADAPWLETIDVVDPSRQIVALSRQTWQEELDPLEDSRVKWHAQDGRQFMAIHADKKWDIITGEPPPPRARGIVSLYSQEYFELMAKRLNPGGVASYWLPVDQLKPHSARAIIKGFCAAFAECLLMAGANYNLILVGRLSGGEPVTVEHIDQLWQHPVLGTKLEETGLEQPGLWAATMLFDPEALKHLVAQDRPLSDIWPSRLSQEPTDQTDLEVYQDWLDDQAAERRFRDSPWVQKNLPESLRAMAIRYYPFQPLANNEIVPLSPKIWPLVNLLLGATDLETIPLWLLDSGQKEVKIASSMPLDDSEALYHRAAWFLSQRDLEGAHALLLPHVLSNPRSERRLIDLALYLSCSQKQTEQAKIISQLYPSGPPPISCW